MTPEQLKTLDFVRDRIERAGFAPTQAEIAAATGTTRPTAMRHVGELERLGLIKRRRHRTRGIELADRTDLRGVGSDALRAELARRGEIMGALSDRQPRRGHARRVFCAADGCDDWVRRGHLFCRHHWFAIPADLRTAITASHDRDENAYAAAFGEARDFLETGRRWGDGR